MVDNEEVREEVDCNEVSITVRRTTAAWGERLEMAPVGWWWGRTFDVLSRDPRLEKFQIDPQKLVLQLPTYEQLNSKDLFVGIYCDIKTSFNVGAPVNVGLMASSLSAKQFLGASISSDGAARLGFLQSPQMLPSPSLRLPARRSQSRHLVGGVLFSLKFVGVSWFQKAEWVGYLCLLCWNRNSQAMLIVSWEVQNCNEAYILFSAMFETHELGYRKLIQKSGKKEHHLWRKRDSAGSGQKALNLVRTVSRLPNEKEVVYGALDKWIAWETEFPLIAAAKALRILRKGNQWKRIIQVAKWMLSKGQGATMATYDSLLLAFDMDGRVDEAEMLWNMILHAHNRSISKRLFSRMISLYDHHNVPDKVIEVFADMEELGVKPDQDTVRRVARAFEMLGQEDNHRLVRMKYQSKWKYIHFNGERVRVRT
ncbi:UNVERIFIED_CONTAM: Pentatricopeptide repeat-containing protein, chloroplastic [Sesamum calycinum]|uniref:Pentatricopeptide repeat-containing protein, chloroplastic n=1 Tax=Sesamum calycinum TaxID=2727403 RepID=A0AAW2LUE3_9LAMI